MDRFPQKVDIGLPEKQRIVSESKIILLRRCIEVNFAAVVAILDDDCISASFYISIFRPCGI